MKNNTPLPEGWLRPIRKSQLDLFPTERDELLALAKVSQDELTRWRSRGWLSFDAAAIEVLDNRLVSEVIFIRNLARSGLSDAQVDQLLKELDAPYQYDPVRTAYNFALGWVETPGLPEEADVDEFVREQLPRWIRGKAGFGEFDVLEELRDDILIAIARAQATKHEDEDPENK